MINISSEDPKMYLPQIKTKRNQPTFIHGRNSKILASTEMTSKSFVSGLSKRPDHMRPSLAQISHDNSNEGRNSPGLHGTTMTFAPVIRSSPRLKKAI